MARKKDGLKKPSNKGTPWLVTHLYRYMHLMLHNIFLIFF